MDQLSVTLVLVVEITEKDFGWGGPERYITQILSYVKYVRKILENTYVTLQDNNKINGYMLKCILNRPNNYP